MLRYKRDAFSLNTFSYRVIFLGIQMWSITLSSSCHDKTLVQIPPPIELKNDGNDNNYKCVVDFGTFSLRIREECLDIKRLFKFGFLLRTQSGFSIACVNVYARRMAQKDCSMYEHIARKITKTDGLKSLTESELFALYVLLNKNRRIHPFYGKNVMGFLLSDKSSKRLSVFIFSKNSVDGFNLIVNYRDCDFDRDVALQIALHLAKNIIFRPGSIPFSQEQFERKITAIQYSGK